jgi:integrase
MASIHSKTSKQGLKTFFVVVSMNGRQKWIRAGRLQDAKQLKRHLDSLSEGDRREKLGLVVKTKKIDELFVSFLENVKLRSAPSTHKRYRAALAAFDVFLKLFHPSTKNVNQLTQEHVEDFQAKRLSSVELKQNADGDKIGIHAVKVLPKPQTVNFEIGVLRSALLWAKDHGWINEIPTRKVKRLKPGQKRQIRFLSQEECKLFLSTAKEIVSQQRKLKPYLLSLQFILNTGLRSGELCNLTWNDIDGELIHIRAKQGWTPKTSERSFYLNSVSLGILDKIEDKTGYVFKTIDGKQIEKDILRSVLIKFAKAAGINGLSRVHDMRHTFASLAQMAGVDRGTVGTILGHESEAMTKIYSHQTSEHLKKSVEKVRIA